MHTKFQIKGNHRDPRQDTSQLKHKALNKGENLYKRSPTRRSEFPADALWAGRGGKTRSKPAKKKLPRILDLAKLSFGNEEFSRKAKAQVLRPNQTSLARKVNRTFKAKTKRCWLVIGKHTEEERHS